MLATETYLTIARRKLVELRQAWPAPPAELVGTSNSAGGMNGGETTPTGASPHTPTHYEIDELDEERKKSVQETTTSDDEIDELHEIRAVAPCHRCGVPLDRSECCWRCRGRLCRGCRAWMPGQPYAIACKQCLQARFTRLEAGRHREPVSLPDDPRLHECPGCLAAGHVKRIPKLWERCANCTTARPKAAPALTTTPRHWWDHSPWYGAIDTPTFRAVVAAYVEAYGEYTPDLPVREPALLAAWQQAPRGPPDPRLLASR